MYIYLKGMSSARTKVFVLTPGTQFASRVHLTTFTYCECCYVV